jgi:two-component system, response regulator, stage 0 sporulation protein F
MNIARTFGVDEVSGSGLEEPVSRRHCILVAEDDADLLALISEELRRDGYDVIEAKDGVELAEQIAAATSAQNKSGFDAIVTDVAMPGPSGLEIVLAMRGAGLGHPIIFMTAFGTDDALAKAWDLGAVAVLDKPFDMTDLRTALKSALRDRRSSGPAGTGDEGRAA